MHPVRMLSTKAKDARKLTIGIEYGWRAQHVWFRAPSSAVYEQWMDVIRAALQGQGGPCDDEYSLAKWVERSGVSMMETATTSAVCSVDRFSADSYARGGSSSFRSDIPDNEWTPEADGVDDTGAPIRRKHRLSSLSARYRSSRREQTDTVNWMGRPAFCFTGPDNMRYNGS
jgi:hypothetical protein